MSSKQAALFLLSVLALAGAGWSATRVRSTPPIQMGVKAAVHAGTPSTILPQDYAGSESCRDCHEERYAQWRGHPHSRMNRDAKDDAIRGDFANVREPYQGGTATFERGEGGSYVMRLERAQVKRAYKVTRVVGSRFMQFYIGVQIEGPEPRTDKRYQEEQKLPFGYWFKLARWLPVSYFDPVGAETKPDGTPTYDPYDSPRVHFWAGNCMLCHNTVPWAYRAFLPDRLAGFDPEEINVAMPQLSAELGRTQDLGLMPRDRMRPDHLVQLGVSCESCHFGGKAHGNDPKGNPMGYLPASPFLRITPAKAGQRAIPDPKNPFAIAGICGQCHCATITQFPNGAGTWNSREALDMAGSKCASTMTCLDCHDPHVSIGREAQADSPTHVAACTKCHPAYATAEGAKKHSRHEKASCLDCHQPRVTQGLEEVVRTHRVAVPAEKSMLAAGAPNACNLCHLDKSLNWTLSEIEKGWQKKISPEASWAQHYGGSLDNPVGPAWMTGADPSTRLVASQAYGRSPLGSSNLNLLFGALNDPVAVNRVFATFAIERVRGKPVTRDQFDVLAEPAKRREQVEKLAK
jgi:hypothetical protein